MQKISNKKMVKLIASKVQEHGGKVYFVGGYVRDKLLNKKSKDYDIEVHGITFEDLNDILSSLGKKQQFGKDFGILSLSGYNIDIAMPRKETQRGTGHKDFEIFVDPFIGTYKAALRRDFTINAIMQDVLTQEVIDHFGGVNDLKNKVIRHVNDETFQEDSLRVLRGCQFASRLEFTIDNNTLELCKQIDLSNLPKERVFDEMSKALLKARKPSIFFEYLREINKLDYWFKELTDLIDCPQNPKYHKEGDVWRHTMMVLDEGAKLRDRAKEPLSFMLACLCHDLGKPSTTEVINGEVHSYLHEIAGIDVAKVFLKRICNNKRITNYVLNMIKLHMRPATLCMDNSSLKSSNKLFNEALVPEDLILLVLADSKGMIKDSPYIDYEDELYDRLNHYYEIMALPRVTGEDLLNNGVKPGRMFSKLIAYSFNLHLKEVPKKEALTQTLNYYKALLNERKGD